MHLPISVYEGKIIRAFLAEEFSFQGKVLKVDLKNDYLLLESKNSQFMLRMSTIIAVCYTPATDKFLDPNYQPEIRQSLYHPGDDTIGCTTSPV